MVVRGPGFSPIHAQLNTLLQSYKCIGAVVPDVLAFVSKAWPATTDSLVRTIEQLVSPESIAWT